MELDRAKRAWTRVTTGRSQELADAEARFQNLQSHLGVLRVQSTSENSILPEVWKEWWSKAQALNIYLGDVPAINSINAAVVLDTVLKQADAIRRSRERRQATALQPLSEIQTPSKIPERDISVLRQAVENARARLF